MTTFLLDENLSPLLARWLKSLHYDAYAVRDVGLKGKSDEDIIAWIQEHGAVLITSDLDFGEFFYSHNLGSFGVIILRSKSQNITAFQQILKNLHMRGLLRDDRLNSTLIVAIEQEYRLRKFNRE